MKVQLILLLKLLWIFAILYDVNFSILPSFTTSRIALIFLLWIQVFKKKTFPKYGIIFLVFLGILIVYSIIQSIYSKDLTQTSRLVWFSLYSIACPFVIVNYIKNRDEFFWLVSIAVFIQAVITITAYLNPGFKSVMASVIISTSNYDETNVIRAIGFASIGGASLSLIQTTGIFSILLLQGLNKYSLYKKLLLWFLLIIILISIFFIGRTGLIISFVAIIIYFFSTKFTIWRVISTATIIALLAQVNFLNLIENVTKNIEGYNTELFVAWVTESFQFKNNETAGILASMPVPTLSAETIIGTGRVRDASGFGNASGNDSGYIQLYYSLGLIMTLIFYFGYFIFLIFSINKSRKYALLILVLIVFMLEFKEPFLFSYSFPFYILCTILLINKEMRELNTFVLKQSVF
jgi:hypothetical protein